MKYTYNILFLSILLASILSGCGYEGELTPPKPDNFPRTYPTPSNASSIQNQPVTLAIQ